MNQELLQKAKDFKVDVYHYNGTNKPKKISDNFLDFLENEIFKVRYKGEASKELNKEILETFNHWGKTDHVVFCEYLQEKLNAYNTLFVNPSYLTFVEVNRDLGIDLEANLEEVKDLNVSYYLYLNDVEVFKSSEKSKINEWIYYNFDSIENNESVDVVKMIRDKKGQELEF